MTVYVVNWSRAITNSDFVASSYCGTAGVFRTQAKAQEQLKKEVDELIADLFEGLDEEDRIAFEDALQIYGGVEENYFEIDYALPDDTVVEWYCAVQETVLED